MTYLGFSQLSPSGVTQPFSRFAALSSCLRRQLPALTHWIHRHTTVFRPPCYAHSSDLAAPLVRHIPFGRVPNATVLLLSQSYCYLRVIQTHYGPFMLSPEGESGVRARLWLFKPPLLTVLPTSIQHPIHLRAGIRLSVTSYSHATLAVLVRLLAPRLGTQSPISPTRPFLPNELPRSDC